LPKTSLDDDVCVCTLHFGIPSYRYGLGVYFVGPFGEHVEWRNEEAWIMLKIIFLLHTAGFFFFLTMCVVIPKGL
jgi:hypothetical protein